MIYGKLVRLRAISSSDLTKLVEWRNDPEIKALLGGWSFPVSLEQETSWFERVKDEKTTYRLAIERKDSGEYIGNVGLYQIDWKNRKAEYAILIGDKNSWGKGFGLDSTKALLLFAFKELNLHRIFLYVLSYHDRAIRLYEKAGFTIEGKHREDNFRDGKYRDTLIMSILETEFIE